MLKEQSNKENSKSTKYGIIGSEVEESTEKPCTCVTTDAK